MPDTTKPRHTAKVIAECSDLMADWCRYCAHPFLVDDDGEITGLADPQPSLEESAEHEVRAAQHESDANFWRTVAPDLPRG